MQKFLRTMMLVALMAVPFASRAQTLPFIEEFSTTLPTGWSLYTGLASNVFNGTPLTSASAGWNFGGNNGLTDNHARVNIYGTSCNKWLVTPSIALTGIANPQLSFDLAFTAYNGSNPAATNDIADDKFMVIISTDDGATWSSANTTKWMIADSVLAGRADYDIAALPYSTFQTFYIDLTAYAGSTIKIAFYGESTVGGGDNNLHLDNIYVGAPITCFPVTNLVIASATSNSITLTWSDEANSGATYTVADADGVIASGISGTTYTVSNLSANRYYSFSVVANCAADDASAAVTVGGRTACAATAALPFVEEFNGYTGLQSYPYYGPSVLPACWIYYSNGENTAETTGSSVYYGGVARYNGTTYGSLEANNPYLYLPIQLTGSAVTSSTYLGYATARGDVRYAVMPAFAQLLNTLQISFDYKMSTAYSATGAAAVLELGYVTNDDIATFVSMQSYNAINTIQHVIELSLSTLAASAPAGARLAFKFSGVHNGTGSASYSNVACGIDNILVENLATCVRVTDLAASEITSNSVTLTWVDTENTGATYSVSDATGVIASGINTTSYTVTGLTPSTEYTFYVLANCSATDMSSSVDITVSTSCAVEELPFTEDFSATLASDLCWRGANNATAAQVFSGTALNLTGLNSWSYASSTKDGLEGGHYYKNVFGSSVKHWMITPAIDLTDVTAAQLSFDVALTDYNAAALPDVNGDTNNSQAFMVIVSTDDGNTWSANNATIWQNEGGDYTYASLASTTYQHKTIDLTPYVGNTIKIAFYTQSLWSGGDNDLHIDNIAVAEASSSTCPTPTVEIASFNNRTVSFSWTSTADSVIVGVFNNDNQQIYGWFATATDSVVDLYLSEDYFPFGYGYVAVMSICGAYEDENYSDLAYDAFAVTCEAEEQCTVTFLLSDSYGDGWNGGALDIYDTVSGLIVGSMTCPDYELENTPVTHTTTYDLCPDRVYSIVYRAGQFDSEVSFTILGPDSTVYGSFSNPAAGVLGYFTHTCPAAADECATVLPFAESFESGELGCWTTDGDGTWSVGTGDYSSSTGAHTGTYNAKITHGSTGNATKLISPVIDMTGVANAELRFWHTQRSWSGDIDQLSVYYRTSATGEWQSLATYTGEYSTWTEEVIYLSNLSSTYQVAFEMTDAYGYGVAIDDVTIDLPPSCAPVTALTASTVTNNSITLEWTDAINTGATYTVSDATGNPIASNITGTTYTVTGLTGNTSYAFAVTANCSADEVSVVTTVTVTTMHDPIMCGTDEALTFTNADSISGTTQYMPAYSYYNYSYSEVIIPMVHLLGLGEIKGMEFYVNSIAAGSSHFNNCEIYLMNTSATSLSNGFIQDNDNLQLVYSGDLNHDETGWNLVTFDSSFMYDGVSNLLVAVRRGDGTYATSGTFGSYTADAQIARYVYNDDNAYTIGEITGGTPTTTVPIYHLIGCEGVAPDCMPISNLTVTDVNVHDVTLNWADNNNSGATYTIYNMGDSSVVATGITGTNYVVTGLNSETTYTFAVEANCSATAASILITVSTTTPPSCLAPSALGVTLTPGNGTVAELSWTAGATETAWQICLNGDENNLIDVTTNPYTLTNLIAETTYTAKVRAYCDVDDQSAWSNTVTFTPTNAYQITVNEGTNTNNYIPIYGLWVDDITKSQFIIPATDLTAMQYGTVDKLTFYSSNDNVNWGAATFNVYLTETNETTVPALADYTTMSQVYAGTLSISNNIMEVTFNTPYTYMGGNLMIGFLQTVSGTYVSCSWYGVTATGASMGGYGTSISQRNFLPKTTISYTPGTQPSCMAVTNLTATNVTANSATLSWTDTENSGVTYSVYQVDATGNTLVASGITTTNYTVTGLNSSSAYTFGVVANCSATDASIMTSVTVNTDCASGSCNITVAATDSYGDGWNGAVLNISQNGVNVTSYTMPSQNLSSTLTFDTIVVSVCAGAPISFSWTSGSYDSETGFAIINANNEVVYVGSGSELTSGQVFFTLDSCNAEYIYVPDSMLVNIAVNDATMGTTVPAPGSHYFYEGDTCSVVAVPNTGYHIEGWYALVIEDGDTIIDQTISTSATDFFDLFSEPIVVAHGYGSMVFYITAYFAADPTCMPVSGLNVTATTTNSVTLNWTDANNTGATYTVYDMADTSVVATNIAATTYTVTGLTTATTYTFGVVANCSASDVSDMATIFVSTECDVISVFPYTQDFSTVPTCWAPIDADGDGYGWELISGGIHSASYDNSVGALTPDNWLITPHFQLAANTNYEVTWNANPQDPSWPAEHYAIYVSTTDHLDTNSYTMLQEWTLTSTGHVPVIDLSAYAGQSIYLAFRHWNCTDMFRIAIDNFELREQAAANQITVTLTQNNPMYGSVSGSGVYTIGDSVTVTATAAQGYQFSRWSDVTGSTVSTANPYTFVATVDVTLQAIFVTEDDDTYTITVAVNDSTMGEAYGSGTYSAGDVAQLVAVPYAGYRFVNWTWNDMPLSTDNPFSMTVTSNTASYPIIANFEVDTTTVPEDYLTIITNVNDASMGTINPAPGTYHYTVGDVVNFSATPYEGYHVESADVSIAMMGISFFDTTVYLSDMSELDMEVDEMMIGFTISITVNFASNDIETAVLNVNVNDDEMGYVMINGSEANTYTGLIGEVVTVEAIAYNGYAFESWNDGFTSSTRTIELTDFVTTIEAQFVPVTGINVAGIINDLKVYPNPTYGVVNIDADDVVKVEVLDLNGRLVATFNNSNRVDLSGLTAGTYMMRIQTTNGNAVKRVVKK